MASKMVKHAPKNRRNDYTTVNLLVEAPRLKKGFGLVCVPCLMRPKHCQAHGRAVKPAAAIYGIPIPCVARVRVSAFVGTTVKVGSRLAATLYFVLQGATLWGCIRWRA